MDEVIRVEALAKTYRMGEVEVQALRGVTLAVKRGEFMMVMGKSGSGKSTFMHILGCLDRPTGGRLWIEGREVSTLSKNELALVRNRKIGFVFQSFNLLPRTSSVANVEVPLIYAGVGAAERRARSKEMLVSVDLADKINTLTSKLSGGQQQRVAVARAIVTKPAIILADEPTGNLDTRSGLEIMAILQRLNAEGITIVMVTHEPDIACLGTRIIRLRDGLLVEDKPNEPDSAEQLLAELPAEHS